MIPVLQIIITMLYQAYYYLCGGKAIVQDIIYRKYNKFELQDRSGEVAVITGGGRGIGFHVVKKLLQCNMQVVIGCRNVNDVKKKFEKEKLSTIGNLEVLPLDMKSLKSVHTFGKTVSSKYTRIHVLFNNAGVMFVPYEETEDGVECHLAVNYLGHLLLSLLLLPNLMKAGTLNKKARIVNVSSCAHEVSPKIKFDDLNMKNGYIANAAYARSKLAQLMSTKRLASIFQMCCPNVNVVSVHPGIVDTELFNGTILKVTAPWVLKYICKNPDEGATTICHAGLGEINECGTLYYANCREEKYHYMIDDLATQQQLLSDSLTYFKQYKSEIPEFIRNM